MGLVAMWGLFWRAVANSRENIMDILRSPSFFKNGQVKPVSRIVIEETGRRQ
jgi:5'(3')-deoxyribonucleotidase